MTLPARATAWGHSIARHIASIMPKAGLFEVAISIHAVDAESAIFGISPRHVEQLLKFDQRL